MNNEDILELLRVSDVLHVSFNDEKYPFTVPLEYGVDYEDDRFYLYIKIEKNGETYKHIQKSPYVSVEADVVYEYYLNKENSLSFSYSSVIAKGKIVRTDDNYALDMIHLKYGFEGIQAEKSLFDTYEMYKIEVETIQGERYLREGNHFY